MAKKLDRKHVEIGSRRIPFRKLFHGKEIREAVKALEDFRLHFNEQEILFGARLTIKMDSYGEATLIATRLETDKEYNDRIEKARVAEEARKERERNRQLMAEARAKRVEEDRKKLAAETIRQIAKDSKLSERELAELLKNIS